MHFKLKQLYHSGFFHLMLSLIFVQGLTYFSQVIVANLLDSPAEFGVIRTMEVVVSISLLIASAGMPSLAIKSIAETNDISVRGRILARLLIIVLLFSIIVASFAFALLPRLSILPLDSNLIILIWIIVLTALSRTCLNYFQGIKEFKRLSLINMLLSLLALSVLIPLVASIGLYGWLIGRYIGELLFLVVSLWMVRKVLNLGLVPSQYSYPALIGLGFPIAVSLVIRAGLDNMGILILNFFGGSLVDVGVLGLAALFTAAVMLPSAAVASVSLPRIIEFISRKQDVRSGFYQLSFYNIALASIITVTAYFLSPMLLWIFGDAYEGIVTVLRILILAVPFRVAGNSAAMLLLAFGQTKIPSLLNLTAIGAALGLSLLIQVWLGVDATTTAWIVTLVEIGLAGLYLATGFYELWQFEKREQALVV